VNKGRRMKWTGHVAQMDERRCVYRTLVGNLQERTLRRPRRKWEDNIKVDVQEIGFGAWTSFIWLTVAIGGGML
jgi:hypothetical protein